MLDIEWDLFYVKGGLGGGGLHLSYSEIERLHLF